MITLLSSTTSYLFFSKSKSTSSFNTIVHLLSSFKNLFHKFRKIENNKYKSHTTVILDSSRIIVVHVPHEVPEILPGSRWCWLAWPAWGCRTLRPTVSSATSVPPLRCSVSKIRSVLFQSVGSGRNERCQCAKHEELRPAGRPPRIRTIPFVAMRNTAGYQLASISIVYQANFSRRDSTDVLYADAIVPRGNISTMHASRINFSSRHCFYSFLFFIFSPPFIPSFFRSKLCTHQ